MIKELSTTIEDASLSCSHVSFIDNFSVTNKLFLVSLFNVDALKLQQSYSRKDALI